MSTRTASQSPVPPAWEDIAEHISVREFRKRLGSIGRAKRVVLVGGWSRGMGLFVPVRLGTYPNGEQILAAAKNILSKVQTVERYREENDPSE
jgi:hypothetical protein